LAAFAKQIADAKTANQQKETAYLTNELQKQYDAIKADFDKLSANAQGNVNSDKYGDDNEKKVTMKSVQDAITAFGKTTKVSDSEDYTNIVANIGYLTSKVTKATAGDTANKDAYDAVEAAYKTALANYTTKNAELAKALNGDTFETLRSEANAAMTAQLTIINGVNTSNKANLNAGKCVGEKDGLLAKLTAATNEINKILSDYQGYATTVNAAVKTLNDQKDAFAAAKKTVGDDALADTRVAADAEKVEKLISNLEKKINANAAKDKVANLADLSADTDAITAAIAELTGGNNYLDFKANKAMQAELTDLLALIDAKVAEVAAYAKTADDPKTAEVEGRGLAESEYNPATYWANTIKFLKGEVAKIQAEATKQFTAGNGAAKTYQGGAYATAKAAVMGNATKLYTEAKTSIDNYAAVKVATEKYQKELDAAKAKVENLEIYATTLYLDKLTDDVAGNKTNYKTRIENVQKQINAITDAMKVVKELSSTKTDDWSDEHYAGNGKSGKDLKKGAKDLADDTSIATYDTEGNLTGGNIKAILDNFAVDNLAWLAENEVQAIAALEKAILEQETNINKLIDELNGAANDFAEYGKDATAIQTATNKALTDNEITVNEAQTEVDAAKALATGKLEALDKIVDKYNKAAEALKTLKDGKAKAAADNFAAYNAVNDKAAEVLGKIADAKTAADAEDPNYTTNVLQNKYEGQVATIQTANSTAYNSDKAVEQKEALIKQLEAIAAAVKDAAKNAKANLEAKKAQDKAYEKSSKNWDDVFTEISSNDESSLLPGRQEELAKLKQQLLEIEDQIAADYAAGTSASNDVITKLGEIDTKVNKILSEFKDPEAYNSQITKDNEATWKAINDAIKAAQEAYTKAAETIKEFKNVKSELLTAAVAAVPTEASTLAGAVDEFPNELAKALSDAKKAYEPYEKGDKPGEVFDKEGKNEAAIKDIQTDIENAEKTFLTAIQTQIATDLGTTITDYKTAVAAAKALPIYEDGKGKALEGKDLESAQNKLFSAANALIGDIEVAQDDIDLGALDEALTAADDDETGVIAQIVIAVNKAAETSLRPLAQAVMKDQSWLTDAVMADPAILALVTDEDYEDYFENFDDMSLEEALAEVVTVFNAAAEDDLADNFDAWKAAIKDLQDAIDAAKADDKAYNQMVTAAGLAQKQLDDAIVTISDYLAFADVYPSLEAIQGQIDAFLEGAETAKAGNTSKTYQTDNKGTIEYKKDTEYAGSVKTAIETALSQTLFNEEYKAVKDAVTTLNEQYVLYVANFDDAQVQEAAAKYKTQIDAWQKELTSDDAKNINKDLSKSGKADLNKFIIDNYKDAKKFPYADLLKDLKTIEDAMAKMYFDMADNTANNPVNTADALKALNEALETVSTAAALGDYEDAVKEDETVKAAQDEILAEIALVSGLIDANKEDILLYADDYAAFIETIATDIENELKPAADAAKAKIEADRAAAKALYDAATETLADATKAIEEAKKVIEGYNFVPNNAYDVKFNQTTKDIADQQAVYDTKKDDLKWLQDDAEVLTEAETTAAQVDNTLADVLNSAAKRQLKGEIDDLQAQLKAINPNESDYTLGDWKSIQNQKTAIKSAIEDIVSPDLTEKVGTFDVCDDFTAAIGDAENPGAIEVQIMAVQDMIAALNEDIENLSLTGAEKATYDLDGDGKVGVADYGELVKAVANQSTDSKYNLNGDDAVDVQDLYIWVKYYQTGAGAAEARGLNQSLDDSAMLQSMGAAEGVTRLAINLNNDAAYQMLQIDINANVSAATATERIPSGMGIYKGEPKNGVTRILVSTFVQGTEIAAGEGAVLYLDVTGFNGEATAKFVTTAGQTVNFNLATGEATAIDGVEVEKGFMQKVYNIGGKLMDGLKKGINIIRNSDGSTKKVVVK
jgi:hypothetical protein